MPIRYARTRRMNPKGEERDLLPTDPTITSVTVTGLGTREVFDRNKNESVDEWSTIAVGVKGDWHISSNIRGSERSTLMAFAEDVFLEALPEITEQADKWAKKTARMVGKKSPLMLSWEDVNQVDQVGSDGFVFLVNIRGRGFLRGFAVGARANPSASHGSVPELAHEFSRILRDWLTEDEIEQVIERNAEFDDPAICASHDFCDANMAMYEAFENIMGHPIDTRKKADVAMWDKAWNMAKASDFAVGRKKRMNPARHPREMSKAEDDAAFVAAMIRAGYSEKEAEKHLASHHRALEEGDEAFMLRAGAARRIRDLSES